MARVGRPPKPTAIKKLQGNPGKRAALKGEPKPSVPERVPTAPRTLSPDARREWRRLAGELHGRGLLTGLDTVALSALCETIVTWKDAKAKVRRSGAVGLSPNGYPIQHPMVSIANQAEKRLRGWLSEFGMTPAARLRGEGEEPGQMSIDELLDAMVK